jgi:hypothetical protein
MALNNLRISRTASTKKSTTQKTTLGRDPPTAYNRASGVGCIRWLVGVYEYCETRSHSRQTKEAIFAGPRLPKVPAGAIQITVIRLRLVHNQNSRPPARALLVRDRLCTFHIVLLVR